MLSTYLEAGGPLMYGVLAAWVLVIGIVLDRVVYALVCTVRRPHARARRLVREGRRAQAQRLLIVERRRSSRGLVRLDAISQLATSVGLFGTVVGIARSFLDGSDAGGLADPAALAAGLSTALYTTVGGLAVFLVGQLALLAFREWVGWSERGLEDLLELREGEVLA
ncbi:MAG: MotA/TolQ/ExbB proton channel family protein [Planctomycetota bacterium]